MGTIFLQGGGSYPQTANMDRLFFDHVNQSLPLLYVSIAMVGHFSREQCYNYFFNLAKDFTKQEVIMWEELKDEDLGNFGGIYIGGGNTFKLLRDIQKTNFGSHLERYFQNDGAVCGGSAGAIIFGKEISTSRDANIVNLKETRGLNMINNHSLWCHYDERDDEEILTYVHSYGTKVIALKETCGLAIASKLIDPIGDVYVFSKTGKEKFNPILWQTEKY